MDAKNKYFMSAVKLREAEEMCRRARESLENGMPMLAGTDIRNAITKLADTAHEIYTQRVRT